MNKQQLASKIWESANKMRSKIEANEYKDYILGFMFYKFLSDKEVKWLKENDWTDEYLPDLTEDDAETLDTVRKNVGYFIAYDNLFSTWISKGSDFKADDVTVALQAFSRLIDPHHKKVFDGVFATLQTGLSKLGESSGARTKAIRDLIYLIKDIPMDGKQDYDVLGFIYEYLISNFAANAGKKAGEFYTPHEVSLLMSEIVAYHLKDREEIKIYDPTSGSGSLLINIGQCAARYMGNGNNIKYYAQELKENTYNLTRMNLVMRGILPDNIVTRNGDTLEEDWPYFEENDPVNTYDPLFVDAVVSNPPYSQAWNPNDKENNPRFSDYGLAPKGKADYAFLLHDLYHIRNDGIVTIVLPHGVLFRGGEEGTIRKNLIDHNNIDAIIGLPANIFFGTGIPTIIMVLRKNKKDSDVLIIDASKGFEKDGKNNKLRACDIKRIVDAYKERPEKIEKFARRVSRAEIVQNDYNLNIPRYVDSSEKAESWDIYASMFGGMSNIKDDAQNKLNPNDIALINAKRLVFIVDECHRSTFGDMMQTIKHTFPKALFFGFTGTPIQGENQKKMSTTATVFGNELHRYSIADGIRDRNVLGFDPYKVLTFKDSDLRKAVALEKAKAYSVDEALADPQKSKVFYKYLNLPMAGGKDALGEEIKGIEDYIPNTQYEGEEHQKAVVEDICENWQTQSRNSKFHAIFATSSIPEAIQYYKRFREAAPWLKVTALFDPNIDNNGKGITKEEGLKEIVEDYNARYGQDFSIPIFAKMKKDIAARLAHKLPYQRIERTPEKQLDLLIVVDQMLTGFDSKWINTLYLDKVLQYENLIQAFSRTNRLFGDGKQFGTIKYYRRPHTMEKNIADAVKEYSGDKPFGLFVDKLDKNVEKLNALYAEIKDLFVSAGIEEFSQIPADMAERKKFADLFQSFNENLEAAKVQGFEWDKPIVIINEDTDEKTELHADFDERTFKVLALRYKELFTPNPDGSENDPDDDVPYAVNSYLTTIDTADIDTDYMNSRFEKYLKIFYQEGAEAEAIHQAETELHKTFATLSQEEQKYANIFLHDIQSGAVVPQPGKTLREYIAEYIAQKQNDQIHKVAEVFGLDEKKLRAFMRANITEANINEFGRFDDLKATVDKAKAKAYFEAIEGTKLIPPKVPVKYDKLLREFIVSGGFDLKMPKES